MELEKNYKDELLAYSKEYVKVHAELTDLENQIIKILDKKNELSVRLSTLRGNELALINKIEGKHGVTLTQELLNDILAI